MQKKELIGNFKNSGRVWRQQADKVNLYDFRYLGQGRAAPYGIYDILHNWGCVVVGNSADTAEFAVDAITLKCRLEERPTFLDESKLLILCDGGGSNGYRPRLWKLQLQTQLADQFGLEVMVCHYPTGASKYNPIERCLFSPISTNWAGTPLRSFETMLGYIRDTSNETGLVVTAFLLDRKYQVGKKVSNAEMRTLNLIRRRICPKCNYIIKPRHGAL